LDALDAAWGEAERALGLAMPPAALELVAPFGGGGWRLAALLAGSRRGVERSAAELGWTASEPGFWTTHAARASDTWARVSAPRRRLLEIVRLIPAGHRWHCSPGVGTAHWLDADDPEQVGLVRAAAEAAGGSLVLLAAPVELKREVGAWGRPPATLQWMQQLKAAFDPRGALAPGRYVV
jgi:FAD/FMN-containing dehydrogenase